MSKTVFALPPEYPVARRGTQVDDYFGEKVADPYRWMEDIDSKETTAWVEAERVCTAEALRAMPERTTLKARLTQLWNYPRYTLPFRRGGALFFTTNTGLQDHPVVCVSQGAGSPARVVVDPNLLSPDGTVGVVTFEPSFDGKLLTYALSTAGSDWTEIHVREVATGHDLPDVIHWAKFTGGSWTKDGRGFFYDRYPDVARGDKLFGRLFGRQSYYHVLGTAQSADLFVFDVKAHPDWHHTQAVSDDGRYLYLRVSPAGTTHTGLYYIDLGDPMAPRVNGPAIPLADAFDANCSILGNRGPVFYVLTYLDAPHGRIVAIDSTKPGSPWTTIVPEGPDSIDQAASSGGRIIVAAFHDAASRLTVYAADGSPPRQLTLPGICSIQGISAVDGSPEAFYQYSSFLVPASIMALDTQTGTTSLFKRAETAFDPTPYETQETFCTSRDGTRIPVFITGRKGFRLDGSTPAWLYGYGGFNIAIPPAYSSPPALWLEMGGIYVQANLRGGSEYGDAWHLAGTRERKQNVFDDFIAAADFLVDQGYTRRDRLVVEGRSNGGLLVGAVVNQRPDLCAVALPGVGVMDMLRYHTFTIGAHWASDYGTSETPEGFRYLRAYSPVHNVREGTRYPAILVTTGDHDDRVFPAHSFKYAAALQHAVAQVPGSPPVLIRIEHNAGHGGSSGTAASSKLIDEWADKIGFAAHFMPAGTLALPATS